MIIILLKNKYVCKDDMIDNKMHGNGKLSWPDGRIYEGEFKADVIEGQGTMICLPAQTYVPERERTKK